MQEENLPHPTFFEFLFGMAVLLSQKQKWNMQCWKQDWADDGCDKYGRAAGVLLVITSIGYDHTELLGNTLEEIAAEKAGIIKKGTPVIYGRC